MGLELAVNPSVLIPRPETEQLVDSAIKHITLSFPNVSIGNPVRATINILDLGTGSGNIAIALAKFVAGSRIVSVDISSEALKVAKKNAQLHGVEDRIEFVRGNINKLDSIALGEFNLIISNPPYIPTNQISSLPMDVQKEPRRALDGGGDGLNFFRYIIKYTPCLLRVGGCLMMEFGDGQTEAVKKIAAEARAFCDIEIIQDLSGRDRIIKANLSS